MLMMVIFGLFLASNIAIVAGYYNTSLGLSLDAIRWVYEGVPVVLGSFLLTALLPINIVFAFFTSRGNYRMYTSELMTLSFITPFLVILSVLPGELEKPSHLQLNLFVLVVIAVGSHLLFSHMLADRAWQYGGREVST